MSIRDLQCATTKPLPRWLVLLPGLVIHLALVQTPAAAYPVYDWPLERPLHDGVYLVAYVDNDTMPGVILDYEGFDWSYDGHTGTDMTLFNFRWMDRGVRVLAGAPGTVAYKQDGRADRNVGPPYPDDGNYLILDNGDGTETWYFHLRRHSLTVGLGDSVERGQELALVGSSGFSVDAHLHFELREPMGPTFTTRDPFQGAANPLPGLWNTQEPYVGSLPIRIYDMGVTTETAAGGDVHNIPFDLYKERMSQPAVLGTDEPYFVMWLQFQSPIGDSYRVEVRRPDTSLFQWGEWTQSGFACSYCWHPWYWEFAGQVSAADHGTWTASVLVDSIVVMETTLEVGPATEFGPRLTPAGRSFRIDGTTQKDTLRVSPLGGSVTFTLPDPPDFVTLVDSVVCVGATSSQQYRTFSFLAVATDAAARTDTMWYQVVDPSKAFEPVTAIGDPLVTPGLGLVLANPYRRDGPIMATGEGGERLSLRVYDPTGRLVRTLLAGATDPRAVAWDGLNTAGHPMPRGVYFTVLQAGRRSVVRKLVLLE